METGGPSRGLETGKSRFSHVLMFMKLFLRFVPGFFLDRLRPFLSQETCVHHPWHREIREAVSASILGISISASTASRTASEHKRVVGLWPPTVVLRDSAQAFFHPQRHLTRSNNEPVRKFRGIRSAVSIVDLPLRRLLTPSPRFTEARQNNLNLKESTNKEG
jgi:hypothetical protein